MLLSKDYYSRMIYCSKDTRFGPGIPTSLHLRKLAVVHRCTRVFWEYMRSNRFAAMSWNILCIWRDAPKSFVIALQWIFKYNSRQLPMNLDQRVHCHSWRQMATHPKLIKYTRTALKKGCHLIVLDDRIGGCCRWNCTLFSRVWGSHLLVEIVFRMFWDCSLIYLFFTDKWRACSNRFKPWCENVLLNRRYSCRSTGKKTPCRFTWIPSSHVSSRGLQSRPEHG